jgi:hypothetical protein
LDKKAALLAIEELIKAKVMMENSSRLLALSRCIKKVMNSGSDSRTLKQAAQVSLLTACLS